MRGIFRRSAGIVILATAVAAAALVGSSSVPAASKEATTVEPSEGPPGTQILVTGTGFVSKEKVAISFDGKQIAKALTNSHGNFQTTTRVPLDGPFGSNTITSVGAISKLPSFAKFFVRTDWPQFGFDAAHTHFNGLEHQLKPANVAHLDEAWIGYTSYFTNTMAPAVADGLVFVQSVDGMLYAFPDQCGEAAATCIRVWTVALGGPVDSPAVMGHSVLASNGGSLEIIPMDCSNPCTGYSTTFVNLRGDSAPTVDGSTVLMGGGDGQVHALSCSATPCTKLWHGVTTSDQVGAPAIAGGRVFAPSIDGKLYVYPERCGTGVDALCQPLWTSTSVGDISGSAPAVAAGSVFVGSADHHLYAFRTTCAAATCGPQWTASTGGRVGSPAVANGEVYVESTDGYLYAFPAACTASCSPSWSAMVGGSSSQAPAPAVANGIVYAGLNGLYAFNAAGCGEAICSPLWHHATGVTGPPAVSNGAVYAGVGTSVETFDIPPPAG